MASEYHRIVFVVPSFHRKLLICLVMKTSSQDAKMGCCKSDKCARVEDKL